MRIQGESPSHHITLACLTSWSFFSLHRSKLLENVLRGAGMIWLDMVAEVDHRYPKGSSREWKAGPTGVFNLTARRHFCTPRTPLGGRPGLLSLARSPTLGPRHRPPRLWLARLQHSRPRLVVFKRRFRGKLKRNPEQRGGETRGQPRARDKLLGLRGLRGGSEY